MKTETAKDVALGAVAGVASTALMQAVMAGSKRFAPQTLPPMKDDPGHFMVKQAERLLPAKMRERIPEKTESFVARGLAFDYGMTFAMLYAALRRRKSSVTGDGTLLGLVTWATGYLGWLPVTKLTPPVWKQKPKQVLPNVASHIVFGIATVAALRCLQRLAKN